MTRYQWMLASVAFLGLAACTQKPNEAPAHAADGTPAAATAAQARPNSPAPAQPVAKPMPEAPVVSHRPLLTLPDAKPIPTPVRPPSELK